MRSFGAEDNIWLNLTDRHQSVSGRKRLSSTVTQALKKISTFPNNIRLNPEIVEAMEIVLEGDVCLSPSFFFNPGYSLHPGVYSYFGHQTDFGLDLSEEIRSRGHFDFIEKLGKSRHYTQGQLNRVIAVFSMCTFGLASASNAPLEMLHQIVDWFRSEDGLAWNTDIWKKSEVGYQCLGAIIRGLADIYGDESFLAKSVKYRFDSGSKMTWKHFRVSKDPLHVELVQRLDEALKSLTMRPSRARQAVLDIAAWCTSTYPQKSLKQIMESSERAERFGIFLEKRIGELTQYTVDQASRARTILSAFQDQLVLENPGTTFYALIHDAELLSMRARLGKRPPKPTKGGGRPLAEKLVPLAMEILDEGEDGWPGKSGRFNVKIKVHGKMRTIYCPVIPNLFRNMIDIPARMAQWRRQDSGEGDVVRYNAKTKSWEINDGPLAGYWADLAGKPRDGFPTQGYAKRLQEEGDEITGIFMNTNKTGEPYDIPWEHHGVLYRNWSTLQWQLKYNPIKAPIPPDRYLDHADDYPEVTKRSMPSIFPLQRLFPTKEKSWQGRIPTTSEIDHAWQHICAEIERRYNSLYPEKPIKIVERRNGTGEPHGSIYTIHGLRSRGITRLYQQGVPIEIISRLVAGHATVLMTIYYLLFDPAYVNTVLSAAAVKAQATGQQAAIEEFKINSIKDARERAVARDEGAIERAHASPSKVEYCNTGIGMCPFDCTRCEDGGGILKKNGKNITYKPVPGNEPNCIVCRHFVTGPAWLVPLELFGTKLLERRNHLAQEKERINAVVARTEDDYKAGRIDRAVRDQKIDVQQENYLRRVHEEIEINETSIINLTFYITACLKIIEKHPLADGSLQLVSGGQAAAIKVLEVTEFEQAATITAAAEVYPAMEDRRVQNVRDRILDRVLFAGGVTPPSLLPEVTDEQRSAAMHHLSRYLMSSVKRSDLKRLTDGSVTLRDLQLDVSVQRIMSTAMENCVMSAPTPMKAIEALEV